MLPSPILGALEARYLQDYRARAGRAARVGRAAPARGPRGPLTFRLLGGEVGYLPAAWLARLGEGELAGQLRGEGPCGRDPAGRPILACTPAAWRQVLTFLASGSVEAPVSPAVVAEVRRLGYPQLTRRLLEHQGGVWVSRSAPPSLLRARVHLTGIVDELATSGTLERRLAGCDGRHWRLWVSRDALLLSPLRPHRRSGPPGLAARAGSVRLLAFDNASLRLPLRRVRGGDGLRATWSEGPRGLDELVSEGVARTPGAVLLDLEVWAAASAGTSGAL